MGLILVATSAQEVLWQLQLQFATHSLATEHTEIAAMLRFAIAMPIADPRNLMPIVPQSEIQVKFLEEVFKETDEKRGEILANFSVDFRPSISREIGHMKFHTNSSTHQDLKLHTAEPKFFHSDTLGFKGAMESR